jgi:hypothetical protein
MNTTDNLPARIEQGGFGFDDRFLQGQLAKWTAETKWIDRDGIVLPSPMAAIGTAKALQRFKNGVCIDIIRALPLPDLDELNASVPESDWETDLTGKPRKPYALHRAVYLIDLDDASVFTFISSSQGGAIAVDRLESRTSMMRAMRGANVSPIVELREARTKTRFGMKSRPEFDIVGWREFGAPEAPQLPAPTATAQSHNRQVREASRRPGSEASHDGRRTQ